LETLHDEATLIIQVVQGLGGVGKSELVLQYSAPAAAYADIQALRTHFPGVYGANGFFDAVNPTTGAVGHRILVLDQSMIMASLDNALRDRAIQRDFAHDPVSWAARTYLGAENMFVG